MRIAVYSNDRTDTAFISTDNFTAISAEYEEYADGTSALLLEYGTADDTSGIIDIIRTDGTAESIESAEQKLEEHIRKLYTALNKESVWNYESFGDIYHTYLIKQDA